MVAGIGGVSALGGTGRRLEDVAKRYVGEAEGRIADNALRSGITEHRINDRAFQLTMARSAEEARTGASNGHLASMLKYFGTEQNKRKYELMLESMGSLGLGWDGDAFSDRELTTTKQWLRSKANSIEGGTSEVQLNVIAKRVLGLPD
jgi:alkylation response protein AidB-like acyl-CoA dehydrogenase